MFKFCQFKIANAKRRQEFFRKITIKTREYDIFQQIFVGIWLKFINFADCSFDFFNKHSYKWQM